MKPPQTLSAAWRPAVFMARTLLDLLLPPACVACDEPAAAAGQLCPACFRTLQFVSDPACRHCGIPFPSRDAGGITQICATCAASPPNWRQARAALLYDDAAKTLILPLKNADRPEIAKLLAGHMARAGAALLAQAQFLVPVPLHRWRQIGRRYNQSALLAQALSRRATIPCLPDGLRRTRPTASLAHYSARQRTEILAGAIEVRATRRQTIAGSRILLIDDVMTSGATAAACTSALLDAGAANVDVLVASRVPDPRRDGAWDRDAED